jgi:hypothetical protein
VHVSYVSSRVCVTWHTRASHCRTTPLPVPLPSNIRGAAAAAVIVVVAAAAFDTGVCLDVLQQCPSTPVLGVCLGQQAMAVAAGGRVVRAPEPVHGRLSTVMHNGHELFAGCPSGPGSGFDVVRWVHAVVANFG